MKKIIYFVLFVALSSLFISCDSALEPQDESNATSLAKKGENVKVQILHLTGNGEFVLIEVSENAVAAHLAHGDKFPCEASFYQGFEENADGLSDGTNGWYGLFTRVESGNDGILSSVGGWHVILEGDATTAPFHRFDGYRDTWSGNWSAELDVYLDPAWATSQGFDYSVASNRSNGTHLRDFIFHVNKDASTGKLLVAGSNNTNFAPIEILENWNHYEVTVAGWYTLQHKFYDNGGVLAVDLNLLDAAGNILFTETRSNASDLITSVVGGNRYGWFTFINVDGGIAADELQLFECEN